MACAARSTSSRSTAAASCVEKAARGTGTGLDPVVRTQAARVRRVSVTFAHGTVTVVSPVCTVTRRSLTSTCWVTPNRERQEYQVRAPESSTTNATAATP